MAARFGRGGAPGDRPRCGRGAAGRNVVAGASARRRARRPPGLPRCLPGCRGDAVGARSARRSGLHEPRHDYARLAAEVLAAYLARPEFDGPEPSLWIGEGGITLVAWLLAPTPELADRLEAIVTAEPANETLELMWGSPGLLLIADALLERTGEERWRARGLRSPIGCWPRAGRRCPGSGRSGSTGRSARSSARPMGSPASSPHSHGGRNCAASRAQRGDSRPPRCGKAASPIGRPRCRTGSCTGAGSSARSGATARPASSPRWPRCRARTSSTRCCSRAAS